jgi:predicted TIM-barrel fold metal-dependent hydrolase
VRLDSLTHVTPDGRWFKTGADASEGRLLREMDDLRIDKAVVAALADYIPNDFVIDVCRRHSGRLVPAGSFNPAAHKTPREAATAARAELQGAPFRIVKLHPRLGHYDLLDGRVLAVLEEASGWPQPPLLWVCSLLYVPDLLALKPPVPTLREIVVRFPNLHFVLLHGAGPSVLELAEAVRGCPNATVDISFTLYRYEQSSVWIDLQYLVTHFNRRTIYGSDFPERGLAESMLAFDRLTQAADRQARDRICGGNLAQLLESRAL